jgi:hypothetical protein
MRKNISVCPFCKFEENLPIFMELSWSFFILFVFHSMFHFMDFFFFSNSSCCEWRLCAIKFGAYCTSYFFRCSVGFTVIMMFGFVGGAGVWGCCGELVHMQSVGEERNQYRCLFLCLVQYGTRGKCSSFCCKDFLVTFLNCRFILTCVFS